MTPEKIKEKNGQVLLLLAYICPECGLSAGTVESAGKVQQAIAEAYRKKDGVVMRR